VNYHAAGWRIPLFATRYDSCSDEASRNEETARERRPHPPSPLQRTLSSLAEAASRSIDDRWQVDVHAAAVEFRDALAAYQRCTPLRIPGTRWSALVRQHFERSREDHLRWLDEIIAGLEVAGPVTRMLCRAGLYSYVTTLRDDLQREAAWNHALEASVPHPSSAPPPPDGPELAAN